MYYALRAYLAHKDCAFDSLLTLLRALEDPEYETSVGRIKTILVPIGDAPEWRQDFALSRSIHAAARISGLEVSIYIEYTPFTTVLVEMPTKDEALAVAITTRVTNWLDVDFGVLQRMPDTAPTRLDTDEDRLAYLAMASVNLSGERYESTGPIAPGTRTIISRRIAAQASAALTLEHLQELSPSSVAVLQASGIGASFSPAPNGRRLVFRKGPRWFPLPRTQIHDGRDAAARSLEERLALSAKEEQVVDFEEPEIARGLSLLFLTAPDARAEMLGFEGSAIRWSLLDRATLSESAFIECDLTGSSLAATKLLELRIVRSCARYASFEGAVVAGSTVEECDLRSASFERAEIASTRFRNCDLRGAVFAAATFERAIFDGCTFDSSTASEIRSRGATIR